MEGQMARFGFSIVAASLLVSTTAFGADQPLFGKKLLIKNPPAGSSKNKLVHLAKDPNITLGAAGSAGDPQCTGTGGGGGSLRILPSGGAGDVTIPLPCEGWTTNGANTLYKYKDASGASCKLVLVKAGVLAKAVCKGAQVAIDLDGTMSPVGVVTTLNTEAYCTEFGGTAVQDGSDDKTFLRKESAAPASCPSRVPESNCLDGLDDNGNGLADCQDPTCLGSQVECVPAVDAGAVLGVLLDSGPCPAGYSQLLDRFQGLQGGACVGCTCATACSVTVSAFATASCTGASVQETFTTTSTSFECRNVASATRNSSIKSAHSKVCLPGGSSSQAPPTWDASQVFCVAQSSQTCAAGEVC